MSFDLGYGSDGSASNGSSAGDPFGGGTDPMMTDIGVGTDPFGTWPDPSLGASIDPGNMPDFSASVPVSAPPPPIDNSLLAPMDQLGSSSSNADIFGGASAGDSSNADYSTPPSDITGVSDPSSSPPDQTMTPAGGAGTGGIGGGGFLSSIGQGATSFLAGLLGGARGVSRQMAPSMVSAGGRSPVYFGGVRPQIPANLAPYGGAPQGGGAALLSSLDGGGGLTVPASLQGANLMSLDPTLLTLAGDTTTAAGGSSFLSTIGGLVGKYLPTIIGTGAGLAAGDVLGRVTAPSGGQIVGAARGPVPVTVTTKSGRQVTHYFVDRGHPLLFSGDLAAVKRVQRVARKLGRFVHHRSRPYARRRRRR